MIEGHVSDALGAQATSYNDSDGNTLIVRVSDWTLSTTDMVRCAGKMNWKGLLHDDAVFAAFSLILVGSVFDHRQNLVLPCRMKT